MKDFIKGRPPRPTRKTKNRVRKTNSTQIKGGHLTPSTNAMGRQLDILIRKKKHRKWKKSSCHSTLPLALPHPTQVTDTTLVKKIKLKTNKQTNIKMLHGPLQFVTCSFQRTGGFREWISGLFSNHSKTILSSLNKSRQKGISSLSLSNFNHPYLSTHSFFIFITKLLLSVDILIFHV